MTSKDMKVVLDRLQSDWSFIAEFLDNPKTALKGLNLSAEEHRALMALNPDALLTLGFEQGVVAAALSDAHSEQCPTSSAS